MPGAAKTLLARDPEFRFLAACCRWPRDDALDSRLRAEATALDWRRAARMAKRHRVEGLVRHALARAAIEPPADALAPLAAAADRIARDNLAAAAESARLLALFHAAEIPLLFVKGLTLGQLAYGTILLKSAIDIDLLVPPDATGDAARLLVLAGYGVAYPAGSSDPARIASWHARSKESHWSCANRAIQLDLHSRLADQLGLIGGLGMAAPRQEVEVIAGIRLPTLARDELFAYLCVHGASSAWFRLKWLADIGALLAGCAPAEIERLYRRALGLGAGRAAGAVLLLSTELLDLDIGQRLRRELEADRMTHLLAFASLRSMAGRAAEREIRQVRFGTAWIHLAQFTLLPGLGYKFGELVRQMGSARPFRG